MNRRTSAIVTALAAAVGFATAACSSSDPTPAPPAPAPAAAAQVTSTAPDAVHTFVTAANAAGLNLDENEYRSTLSKYTSRATCNAGGQQGLMWSMDLTVDYRVMAGGSVDKGAVHNAVLNFCDSLG